MIYINSDGKLFSSDNTQVTNAWGFISEIRLYQGENPMNTTAGVDYVGVLDNRVMLRATVEDCCQRWQSKFKGIELGDVTQNGEKVQLPIRALRYDGETVDILAAAVVRGL